MKIAIIGAGNVGSALGAGWGMCKHDVVFGARDPKKTAAATKGKAAPVAEAVQSADVVVFAVPWPSVREALQSMGDLKGKILLDATNPLLPDLSGLEPQAEGSGGELIASLAPGARVVKIFNSTGAGNMANPDYSGRPVTMFYCGDDAEAKSVAARLARDLGFNPVDAGPLSQSRTLEPLALLWVTLAYKQNFGLDFALNLVQR